MKNDLKLFVWEDVLCDYTCGMAVALAKDVEDARKLLIHSKACTPHDLREKPKVRTGRCAFSVYGGG